MARGERKKEMHLWLDVEVYGGLKELARQRRTTVTALVEQFVQEGLGMVAAERLEGPALPAVRQVVEEVTARHADRLASLIVKTFIEAAMGRRLTYPVVHKLHGQETAAALFDAAKTRALDDLKKRLGQGEGSEGEA